MASPSQSELKTETGHQGGAASSSFPPFNAETFAPQLVWLALTFTALYVILSRFALPRIGEVIDERRDRIQRDLSTAERLKDETEQAIASYEQALADARSNASTIAAETRDKVNAEIDAERAKNDAEIAETIAQAEARIAETRANALANVDDIATEVAEDVVRQLTGAQVSTDEVRKALAANSN